MIEKNGHFFEVYGPFKIELIDGLCYRPSKYWWDTRVNVYDGPSPERGIGCYMFTMGDADIKPWYIGKTICQGSFREEAFDDHKLQIYNEVISRRRGPAMIYFFPLITKSFSETDWNLSENRSGGARAINWLEKFLIGMAYGQNSELMNRRDVVFLRTVHLRGILGKNPSGRPHGEIEKARQALRGK
ncbi:hypothetical protein [Sphingomonas sp. Leaf33]|uniref:hypothetical protein n=1 Tax=Sphingomonas sp. Leaf33 TaxID=1736215 RepID=UPI0012E1520D|nr:hypothetical protein [Sphingomonas sp. Leaf33]